MDTCKCFSRGGEFPDIEGPHTAICVRRPAAGPYTVKSWRASAAIRSIEARHDCSTCFKPEFRMYDAYM